MLAGVILHRQHLQQLMTIHVSEPYNITLTGAITENLNCNGNRVKVNLIAYIYIYKSIIMAGHTCWYHHGEPDSKLDYSFWTHTDTRTHLPEHRWAACQCPEQWWRISWFSTCPHTNKMPDDWLVHRELWTLSFRPPSAASAHWKTQVKEFHSLFYSLLCLITRTKLKHNVLKQIHLGKHKKHTSLGALQSRSWSVIKTGLKIKA